MSQAERIVAGFGRALRAAGLMVPTGSLAVYTESLSLVGLEDGSRVYWAGRATLVRRPEDIPVYDRVFEAYWHDRAPLPGMPPPPLPAPVTLAVDDEVDQPDAGPPPTGDENDDVQLLRYSAFELLRKRDLSQLTDEEWAEAARLISSLRVSSELRPSRRTRASRRATRGRPDLRGTLRRNMPNGGVPMRRSWRRPVDRPRRVVFLLDVSGSMEAYSRGLARLAHAAVASRRAGRVEVFTVGTRLTRITRALARRDPDAAFDAVSESVTDWAGGTRLGATLREFNDTWGVRGVARGAIVVVCSDGWDRGDPQLVAEEMQRLQRVARRVVWVNPLKASPGYAPFARGMAAALPYVDQFVEGHSVSSLEQLAAVIARPGRQEVPA